MMKNTKMTEAEKTLIKFRNQLHNLLIKYPEVRLAVDSRNYPDIVAFIPSKTEEAAPRIALPLSGAHELIK